jgi:hypothetical protein
MSRGYRLRLPTIQRTGTAKATDALRMDIDLLPILEAADMHGLLAEGLKAAGWREVDGRLQAQVEGATVELHDDHIQVHLEAERTVTGTATNAAAAKSSLNAKMEQAREQLDAQVRRKMAKVEAALCEQLEPIVQGVYVEALKRKAAKMGEVTHVDERRDGDQVELTIRVKV